MTSFFFPLYLIAAPYVDVWPCLTFALANNNRTHALYTILLCVMFFAVVVVVMVGSTPFAFHEVQKTMKKQYKMKSAT